MICSPSKSLLIAAFCLITLPGVHPARRVKVEKPRKSIDWNNSYYASRFAPCKKLRILDPVESFKAQAYAAEIFRKCGPKMIVKLGSKYNFPAFGISKLMELVCWSLNVVYGFLAVDNGLIVPESTLSKTVFAMYKDMFAVLRKNNISILMKDGGNRYTMTLDFMTEFANDAFPCVFHSEKISQRDADYLKHLLHHTRIMLL